MSIYEKAFFMLVGGILVSIINHFYVKKRERESEIRKYLFQIANNMRALQFEYTKSCNFFVKNNFKEGKKARSNFLKIYNETYNLIYFYFEEIAKIYTSQMTPVVDNLYKIEEVYKRRTKKDELNIKRNKINEFLCEDQYFIEEGKFFYELYELIKIKLKSPIKIINFKRIDNDDIFKYDPNNSRQRI
ncbi:hypothetical protein CPG37_02770 [Malaciobacter canalis]|uniref:Uncharacterized protein n=1 Tax=Malaciobacter canalis TaxID=1912871 RepID=A0ABX4LWB2_9BACT|nr:hypothetical protein [Malaciobacter canalis]PHO10784.1 hypothetical protein CPG37_02770 [Malaciobacter canalis]QEE33941.1 hypothetical protein ACAN_2503 [Malaciobacter canalis]